MLNKYQGIINLSENDINLSKLTTQRPIASIPFAGRYRVIDFALSNMVNAGINNIGIFTDYNYRSLMDHLNNGKPWDLDRKIDGLFLFPPIVNPHSSTIARGDIRNFYDNLNYIRLSKQENVLIMSSYMLANINFEEVDQQHQLSGADITIVYKPTTKARINFDKTSALQIGKTGKVLSVGQNLQNLPNQNISMEMFLMKKSLFIDIIMDTIAKGKYVFLNDAIHSLTEELHVHGFPFTGYLKCINSTTNYYEANMDCLNTEIADELFYSNRRIFTKIKDESPTYYSSSSRVSDSFIANGCVIEGEVHNSIIFRRVTVEKGASIRDSIILQNGVVKKNAQLNRVILDKNVTISERKELIGDKNIPIVVDKNRTV